MSENRLRTEAVHREPLSGANTSLKPGTVIVQKYGGSSLSNPAMIRQVAERLVLLQQSGAHLVIVVSAMGDTTDELFAMANEMAGEGSSPDPRELDFLLSTGELVTATLMAIAVRSIGGQVVSLSGTQAGIRTDDVHGSARISGIDVERLRKELNAERIVIVAGFQGLSKTQDVTTLGRGGSDTTAVALAAALGALRCEIYTDVDGIYTADPRMVPGARRLPEINYEEMLEMAVLGAKMNPRSIELAALYGVPVVVASTFGEKPGTLIYAGASPMEIRRRITAVVAEKPIAKITVRGVRDRPGVAAGLFEPLAASGISVDVIVQNAGEHGATDMSFTVSQGQAQRAIEITQNSSPAEGSELVAGLNLAKVSIVGTGMQNTPGYAARMFKTLADAGVNIEMISTSEVRITCIVDADMAEDAVRALHTAFDLDEYDN